MYCPYCGLKLRECKPLDGREYCKNGHEWLVSLKQYDDLYGGTYSVIVIEQLKSDSRK